MGLLDYHVNQFAALFPRDSIYLLPTVVILLIISNFLMSIAWYHHLKHPEMLFLTALGISMFYVFFEYIANIHGNALGKKKFSLYQLKILQEAITIAVFIVYAFLVFKEEPTPKYLLSFGLIFAGVWVAFS